VKAFPFVDYFQQSKVVLVKYTTKSIIYFFLDILHKLLENVVRVKLGSPVESFESEIF